MNFKIIEGYNPYEHVNIEEFKEDYAKLSNPKLIEKYRISMKQLQRLSRKLDLPKKPPRGRYNPKYYCLNENGGYVIYKTINDKRRCFGTYDTEEEAKERVELLKKNNWDTSLIECRTPKYYTYQSGKYEISKNINGKNMYFGFYDTEEEAKERVELLKKNNWDTSLIEHRTPKHYNHHGRKYNVKKIINGEYVYFGVYATEEEAQAVVEWLKRNNWDKDLFQKHEAEILKGVLKE